MPKLTNTIAAALRCTQEITVLHSTLILTYFRENRGLIDLAGKKKLLPPCTAYYIAGPPSPVLHYLP